MLLFIYGEDTYRVKQRLAEIIEKYGKERDLRVFACEEESASAFSSELHTPSLFSQPKLFVFKDVFSNNWSEELLSFEEELEKEKAELLKLLKDESLRWTAIAGEIKEIKKNSFWSRRV